MSQQTPAEYTGMGVNGQSAENLSTAATFVSGISDNSKILIINPREANIISAVKSIKGAEVWIILEPRQSELKAEAADVLISDSVENSFPRLSGYYFDAVIFPASLEGLQNPVAVLKKLLPKISPSGKMYIECGNAMYFPIIQKFLEGVSIVTEDRTAEVKRRFYNRRTLETIISRSGYNIDSMISVEGGFRGNHEGFFDALDKQGVDIAVLTLDAYTERFAIVASPVNAALRGKPIGEMELLIKDILSNSMKDIKLKQYQQAFDSVYDAIDKIHRVELPGLAEQLRQCESVYLKLKSLSSVEAD